MNLHPKRFYQLRRWQLLLAYGCIYCICSVHLRICTKPSRPAYGGCLSGILSYKTFKGRSVYSTGPFFVYDA